MSPSSPGLRSEANARCRTAPALRVRGGSRTRRETASHRKKESLAEQAARARQRLESLARVIQKLRDERVEILSHRTQVEVSLEIDRVLRASAFDVDARDDALENVREATAVLEHMVDCDEPCDEGRAAIDAIKRDTDHRADREALAALRRELGQG